MCRLMGIHGAEPQSLGPLLIDNPWSLLCQSRNDRSQTAHADGWGIGWYQGGQVHVVKSQRAASAQVPGKMDFTTLAQQLRVATAVAHVRRASVGTLSPMNSHPFVFEHWLFAHNGTLAGFDHLQKGLFEETRSELQAFRQGQTDSEQIFVWLLSRLADGGVDLKRPTLADPNVPNLVARALKQLSDRSESWWRDEPSALNLVLTDGVTLLAARWGRSLSWRSAQGTAYVASEPLDEGATWREVPDRHGVRADAAGNVEVFPL